MVIATREVNFKKILSIYEDEIALKEYIESLVPVIYRHTCIVGNQAFYINSVILKDESISIDLRRAISSALLKGIRVCGVLGEFIEISVFERRVNKNKINKYHEGELV